MKFSTWLNALTEKVSPSAADDLVAIYDVAGATSKKVKLTNLPSGTAGIDETGWVASGETWTFAAADDPTYTLTISGDKTAKYSAGMRVKLTQTTVRYFIITKVAYSDPSTTLTLYGGTDYDLDNAAITSPNYSAVKAPVGFPLDPIKWTEKITDTTNRSQASPVATTWYNLGSVTISVPIGAWQVSYKVSARADRASSTVNEVRTTLSTANNSASDAEFTTFSSVGGASGTIIVAAPVYVEKHLVLASKTSYYLNTMTEASSVASISNVNSVSTLVIRLVCAYL